MAKNTASIHEAKTHLSKILVKVLNGEEFIITKSGQPLAKIVPIKYSFGSFRHINLDLNAAAGNQCHDTNNDKL